MAEPSVCYPPRFRVLVALGIAAALLFVFSPGRALAGKLQGGTGVCKLQRSPWVPHRATPEPWECTIDEDDDGLDDEMEAALANCYAPELHFAPGESDLAFGAKFPGGSEPFVAFNVFPDKAKPNRVHIKFGTLYGKDGGYYDSVVSPPPLPSISFCGQGENKHPGDAQSIDVEAELVTGSDGRAEAQLVRVDTWHRDVAGSDSTAVSCEVESAFPELPINFPFIRILKCLPPSQTETLRVSNGTHPVVFASWGKHHYYLNPPDGMWTRKKAELFDPVGGLVCAFLSCSGWIEIFENIELTSTTTASYVVKPVLSWAYPTPLDKPVPTNVGAVVAGSATALEPDRAALCQSYSVMYTAVCSCDPALFPACAATPSDPTVCPTVKSLRDLNCSPPPAIDSPPASACLTRKNMSGPSKFIGSLKQLYPGASFQSGNKFCGTGEVQAPFPPYLCSAPECATPLVTVMGGPKSDELDSDGDGAPNNQDLCPAQKPLFGVHLDGDEDGAGNECDPSALRDLYVGGKGFPALAATGYESGPGFAVDYKRRGWADTDSDGQLNGADFCPSTPGVVADKFANVNEWGEQASFPGAGSPAFASYAQQNDPLLGTYAPSDKNAGFLKRGTLCDPYEASAMKEDTTEPDEVQGDPCPPIGLFGKNEVFLSVTPARGMSANDPALTGTKNSTYVDRLKQTLKQAQPVLLDARRCGCPEFDSGGKAACLHPLTGSCPQGSPLPSSPITARRWLPVERKGCPHQTFGGQPYCTPLPARAGVPPPVICPIGPSASCPPSDPAFWPKPYAMSWAWVQEAKTYPGHFPSDWLTTGFDIVTQKQFLKTKPGLRFTFATRTFLSSTGADGKPVDTDAKPHRYPAYPQLARVVGNQADPNPDRESATGGTVPLQVGNERAGNLRTTFTERFIEPVEPHLAINQDPTCPDFVNASPHSDAIHLAYGPGCWPLWICFQSLDRDSVLVRAGDLTLAALLRFGDGGRVQPIQVASPDGSILGGLDCLVSGDCGGLGIAGAAAFAARPVDAGPAPWRIAVINPEAAGGARHATRPDLVLVAGAGMTGRPDRLWRLSAASTAGARARYVVTRTGTAPPGTALADAFLDSGSNSIVAFGEATATTPAWLRVLELENLEWTEPSVDPSPPARSGAAYVLFDSALYRAGGHDGTELRGDLIALDWRSGAIADTSLTGDPFPRRSGPFLGWDAQGAGLIYAGGTDASGVAHSDVWSLRVGVSNASRIARDVALPPGSPAIGRGSMVLASGASSQALWWTVGPIGASDQGTHTVRIAEGGGWIDADPRTLASSFPRCGGGAEARRCATGTEWWRAPGALCGGTCRARLSETTAAVAQLPGTGVTDIALEGSSLWVARGDDVELWTLLDGTADKITSIPLGAPVRALAEQDGLLAVATDAGVTRIVGGSTSSTSLGAPVDVCGLPTHLVGVGQGQWLVATTSGAALLRTSPDGVLEIASEGFLESTPSGWTLMPRTSSAEHSKKCAMLDKAGCGAFCGPDLPRRLAFDGRDAELGRGLALIRLRWDGDGVLAVHDSLKAQGVIRGVKSAASVSYLVPGGLLGNKEDAVSLEATLAPAGKHDVGDWVLSEQSGGFRARLKPGGRVEVAWVAP